MWKIVRAELHYLKPAIRIAWGFFIALSLFVWFFVKNPVNHESSFSIVLFGILITHGIFNFTLLYLEASENRTRLISSLPIPRRQVGFARLLAPALLFGAFLLLCVAHLMTVPSVFFYYQFCISPFDRGVGVMFLLLSLGIWLTITYAIRLFTEYYGRILLAAWLAWHIVVNIVISVFGYYVCHEILMILEHFLIPPAGTLLFLVLPIGLCRIIHVSYMRRRSYLSM